MRLSQSGRHPRHRAVILALAVIVGAAALASDPADARARRKRNHSSYKPPYAAIVVDANSGQVMHASNPDAVRHPASLTKIMTLYLLFEQLEAGKLKLDSRFEVSEHAASQAPSKLGLKPGQTIAVEDAIKALVTKSANDAAVVVAEGIAGDEDEFAKRMTRKARALGMNRTIYANASGLPDPDQVTTARDQAILGRAIQDRFPRHYRYFATPNFQYRGVAMRNHNKLLGRVSGVDGIKTGYTHASGFNLVSSMRRGNRHIVAVVLGGASAGARDARMRALLGEHIQTASAQRTAPAIAEAKLSDPAERRGDGNKAAARPAPAVQVARPSAAQPAPRSQPAMGDTDVATVTGSSDPIKPVSVKTITVRAGGSRSAALSSMTMAVPMASAPPLSLARSAEVETAAPSPPGPGHILAAAESKPSPAPATRALPSTGPAAVPPRAEKEKPETIVTARASETSEKPGAARRKGEWIIQVGAFPDEAQAKERLKRAKDVAKSELSKADPFTETVVKGAAKLYRARFAGFTQGTAEAACKHLKRNAIACMALKQ